MRARIVAALIVTAIPVLLTGTALGGEGVQVKITNDGTQDIVVTVYDMNTRPERVVLENARINGFTSVPINAIGDATGRANLSWTATSTLSCKARSQVRNEAGASLRGERNSAVGDRRRSPDEQSPARVFRR